MVTHQPFPQQYDDEIAEVSATLSLTDGQPFPFDNYTIEFVAECRGSPARTATDADDAVTIDADAGTVLWRIGQLPAAVYRIGCRLREPISGDTATAFVAYLPILEGPF